MNLLPHSSSRRFAAADLLQTIPVLNSETLRTPVENGAVRLTLPLKNARWISVLRFWLPLSRQRRVELDHHGVTTLSLLDGRRTLESMVELHQQRWKLSWFEAQGMVLDFLRPLVKGGFVALVTQK
jgi:hypothetical protein